MKIAALDIGGTKTIAAIVNEDGVIQTSENFPSVVGSWQEHLELCAQALERLMARAHLTAADFAGLGVSLPGIVDSGRGELIYAPYAGWEHVPVAEVLSRRLGFSGIRCENDVNACAIGELKFGLGSTYSDFVWMTVSTGVGGAVVEHSQLVRGGHGFAGELGHIKVEYTHPEHCPCGQEGCLEAHGSGTALIRETKRRCRESETFARALSSAGWKPDGAGCAALARAGNPDALEIMDRIGTYLGRGISCCVNILDPQAVVIGGGVAASLDLLLPSIRAAIRADAFGRMQDVEILRTPLGYEAALYGAAALVLD